MIGSLLAGGKGFEPLSQAPEACALSNQYLIQLTMFWLSGILLDEVQGLIN